MLFRSFSMPEGSDRELAAQPVRRRFKPLPLLPAALVPFFLRLRQQLALLFFAQALATCFSSPHFICAVVLPPPTGFAPLALPDAAARLVIAAARRAPDLDRLPYQEIGPAFPEPEGLEALLTGLALARGSPKRGNRLSLVNWFVARRAQFWCRRAF